MMQRRRFTSMGTQIELVLDAPPTPASRGALEDAELEVHRIAARFSRFRWDSELSELNRSGDHDASPEMALVVRLAVAARESTTGRFDPTVHEAMLGAGYEQTFAALPDDIGRAASPRACGGDVTVTDDGHVSLAPGVKLDLGGIVKGYAAERACSILAPHGRCLVDAGGDIATRGAAWPVGVATADGQLTLLVEGGGVATTGTDRRRWLADGAEAHHLIDPATGLPSTSDLLRVTVVAYDAIQAEVRAKALFLAGEAAATADASIHDLAAVLVTRDGRTVLAGGIAT